MPHLRFETSDDSLDLTGVSLTGYGVEALSGVTGLGLPPVAVNYIEGAGDGAVYRGERIQPRDLDIPLYVRAPDREQLKVTTSRLTRILTSEIRLWWVEDNGEEWGLVCRRLGGGGYIYGKDTVGYDEAQTVVTLRAGQPLWQARNPMSRVIVSANAGRGLLKGDTSLSMLRVSGSAANGVILFESPGDAKAVPVWTIRGPIQGDGEHPALEAISPTGERFAWDGVLSADDTLTIDTGRALVYDQAGVNRYDDLLPAPRLWRIPSGQSRATIMALGTGGTTRITATWYPRKWAVI
ncbi:phage tail family protein [Micromonospora sp. NBC_01813]|uniref:phage tail family protein n=1 Tax=Micromonospora sp. NBC_01813 TaxID=2975988 RepID=UPI002DDBC33F|nr:phage tail family protein [Micromonospora sp. NBC_01813]WSA11557.1 phage tail family protein [Micromonospora sp. NBC_01813]